MGFFNLVRAKRDSTGRSATGLSPCSFAWTARFSAKFLRSVGLVSIVVLKRALNTDCILFIAMAPLRGWGGLYW